MQNEELTLTLLRKAEVIESQKSIADELGISVGKVNYVLKALIEKGLIKAEYEELHRELSNINRTSKIL